MVEADLPPSLLALSSSSCLPRASLTLIIPLSRSSARTAERAAPLLLLRLFLRLLAHPRCVSTSSAPRHRHIWLQLDPSRPHPPPLRPDARRRAPEQPDHKCARAAAGAPTPGGEGVRQPRADDGTHVMAGRQLEFLHLLVPGLAGPDHAGAR